MNNYVMRLLLIRHAQSENNQRWSETRDWTQREADPAITELGRAQAQALATKFANRELPRPDVLLTSLMKRAVQTVAPIAEALQMPVTGHLAVHEVGGVAAGTYPRLVAVPGLGRTALSQLCSRLVLPDAVTEDGWYQLPVEEASTAYSRAKKVLQTLQTKYTNHDLVALVTHGIFGQLVLRAALNYPPEADGSLPTYLNFANTGHALLELPNPDDLTSLINVHWLNRTDHLSTDQLT